MIMMIIGTPIQTLMSDTMITISKTFIPFIYWEEYAIWSGSVLFAYRMYFDICMKLQITTQHPWNLKENHLIARQKIP